MKIVIGIIFAFIASKCTNQANGSKLGWGNCPNVTVKSNFIIENFLGTWYEIARYSTGSSSIGPDDDARCSTLNLSPSNQAPWAIDVVNSYFLENGSLAEDESVLRESDDEPAKFSYCYGPDILSLSDDFWVLDTDYATYALIHYCEDYLSIFHTQIEYIVSRSRTLDGATLDQMRDKLAAQDIDTDEFIYMDQSDCGDQPAVNLNRILYGHK